MDVRAVIIAGAAPESETESFAGRPFAALPVLGKSAVERTADRMRRFGVGEVSVICTLPEQDACTSRFSHDGSKWQRVEAKDIWTACQEVFSAYAQSGAEIVLVQRMGAYAEVNYDHLVQFHLDQKGRVTSALDADGALGLYAISASRRNDAAFLFRNRLEKCRSESVDYHFSGYVNRLRDASQYRALACDALFQRNEVAPVGRQLKPGVWVGEGAHIERGVRLVAPAYIGCRSRIRAASVITRGTSVEHHAEVDCGAVVEDSCVLPFTYVGAGLDVAHSVLGFQRLAHLRRQVEVEIGDPKLLGALSPNPTRRAVAGAFSMVALALHQGALLFSPSLRQALSEGERSRSQAPDASFSARDTGTFSENPDLMVARRYGND